jgi:hypothetical protein
VKACWGPLFQYLLPLEPIPSQEQWFTPPEEHLIFEKFLQVSTSYGPRKAENELTKAICSHFITLPSSGFFSALMEINEAIKASAKMLELGEDWDGEGASRIAESTWERAAQFLRDTVSTLWTVYGRRTESPSIVPASDGSIDLHWKLPSRELLINIPSNREDQATYYGDNKLGWNTVEGRLDTNAPNPWLFVWLAG